jgi:Fe-S-cluster containining protein
MIHPLKHPYASREGVPVIDRVHTAIFHKTFFSDCPRCTFCHDACCSFGTDVDTTNLARIMAHAPALEALVGIPAKDWFAGPSRPDPDFPGGEFTRTRVAGGACVFLNRKGRGCLLHLYCQDRGIDVHDLKPLVCSLFPITFDQGLLHPSAEIMDNSLICGSQGLTLYRAIRKDLGYYFGPELLAELDELEAVVSRANTKDQPCTSHSLDVLT